MENRTYFTDELLNQKFLNLISSEAYTLNNIKDMLCFHDFAYHLLQSENLIYDNFISQALHERHSYLSIAEAKRIGRLLHSLIYCTLN